MAAGSSRVRLDLNSPAFPDVFLRLELVELKQVVASLRRLREIDWNALLRIISLHPDYGSAYRREP